MTGMTKPPSPGEARNGDAPTFALAKPPSYSITDARAVPLERIALQGRDLANATGGSRRRRLWELGTELHCSVLGVCIPIDRLRVLMEPVLGSQSDRDDYRVHCQAIDECRHRSPLAEALQRELERRYALVVRHAHGCKTTEVLYEWWVRGAEGADVPGTYWTVMTHPRCTPALQKRVLGDMHMLQHHAGVAQRVDVRRFSELAERCERVSSELDAVRKRAQEELAERCALIERQGDEAMRLRAALIGRDTIIESLREELAALATRIPEMRERVELTGELARAHARNRELETELADMRRSARSARAAKSEEPSREEDAIASAADAPPAIPGQEHGLPDLRNRSVLCVGGRTGNVPAYRALIERAGADFQHHDGGIEDRESTLSSVLAAADLVICQVGCISHGAYWRVKDHCKRSGKPCIFVENPSASGLARSLTTLALESR